MENGIIANNKKEFVDDINLLLNDKNLKEEVVRKASESIQKYELETVKEEMSKIYNEMLEIEKKPIRVLQVIRHMNIGGAETFIMNVYRNIDREKVQFDFLVNGEGVFDEEIKKLGGKIHVMKYITEIGQIKYKKNLKNFFNEHNYNIVHSHIDQVSGIILEAANECNIKCRIAHSHSTKNANNIIGKIYKKYLQTKINRNANLLLACGEEAAKWLYKDKSKETIIINNGIDLEKFYFSNEKRIKIRKEWNISDDFIVLGHVGRFAKVKNHEFLIKVYYEYLKDNPKSILVLVGTGDLKQKIKKMVENYEIEEHVKFLGNRQDVSDIYCGMDCFVFPSLYEGISISMIEAQVSGLNIFASDTIDKNTDISGNIKWLSIKETPKTWSKEVLEMPLERNVKNIRVQDYNIKNVANKLQNLYLNYGGSK